MIYYNHVRHVRCWKKNPFLDVSFAAKGFFGQSDQEHPSAQIIEQGSGTGIIMHLDRAQRTCKDAKLGLGTSLAIKSSLQDSEEFSDICTGSCM